MTSGTVEVRGESIRIQYTTAAGDTVELEYRVEAETAVSSTEIPEQGG